MKSARMKMKLPEIRISINLKVSVIPSCLSIPINEREARSSNTLTTVMDPSTMGISAISEAGMEKLNLSRYASHTARMTMAASIMESR